MPTRRRWDCSLLPWALTCLMDVMRWMDWKLRIERTLLVTLWCGVDKGLLDLFFLLFCLGFFRIGGSRHFCSFCGEFCFFFEAFCFLFSWREMKLQKERARSAYLRSWSLDREHYWDLWEYRPLWQGIYSIIESKSDKQDEA